MTCPSHSALLNPDWAPHSPSQAVPVVTFVLTFLASGLWDALVSQSIKPNSFSHLPGHPLAHIHLSILPPCSPSKESSDSDFLISLQPLRSRSSTHMHSLSGPDHGLRYPITNSSSASFYCGIFWGKVYNSSVPQFPHLCKMGLIVTEATSRVLRVQLLNLNLSKLT